MPPKIILLFSGKRKCGKDYLTNHIQKILGDRCEIIKISEPIKSQWAKEKNLDLKELLGDGTYKEQYRLAMIQWSDEIREKDYGYFCKVACSKAQDKPVWIVSDIRRTTDVQWFKETYGELIKTIRLVADEETRKFRGFQYTEGVDNVASECGLDDYKDWDLVIDNGKERRSIQEQIDSILALLPDL